MTKTSQIACVLATLALLCLALSACRNRPDEEQVRDAIAAVAQAAEAGSASDVGVWLSEDFDGNAGALDRRRLTGMVRLLALRDEHVGVTMGPVSIEHRGERMIASFTVSLTRGGDRLLPEKLGIYQVDSAWRNEDGAWRCYNANWQRSM